MEATKAPGEGEAENNRELFLTKLLETQYGRQVTATAKLGQDSNNFVYRVTLSDKVTAHSVADQKLPGCSELSSSATSVVMRISNPRAMLDNTVRVQNEVAALQIGREALASHPEPIVPQVYGWSSAAGEGYGWIMEEFMTGEFLGTAFETLSASDQGILVAQMAQILKSIQEVPMPAGVDSYGGLSYNTEGQIVSGLLTFGFGGPYETLEDMYRGTMRKQIELCDKSESMDGWRSSNLRSRLDAFLAGGEISKIMGAVPGQKLTLVHGDFDIHNLLFDPTTLQITALLDFDFAHVACPLDEYFYSFQTIHGLLPSPLADEGDNTEILRRFLLDAEMKLPETSDDINWTLARTLQEELSRTEVVRPGSSGKGSADAVGEIAALFWFIQEVCPPWLVTTRWTAGMTPDQLEKTVGGVRGKLEKYLDRWGC